MENQQPLHSLQGCGGTLGLSDLLLLRNLLTSYEESVFLS